MNVSRLRSNALRRLNRDYLAPAVLASALAVAVLAARFFASGTLRYRFLVWNLFLAWVPYVCSVTLAEMRRRGVRSTRGTAALFIAWLLFLPNAPYLVTDFVHLLHFDGFDLWYDVGLIAAFAWAGLVLTVASLRLMRQEVAMRFGAWWSHTFIAAVAVISGVGIYLGRVLRWNSWDIVLRPGMIARWIAEVLGDPMSHRRGAVISMVFAAFVWVCYATFGDRSRSVTE